MSTPFVAPRFFVHSERGGSHTENEDVALASVHPGDNTLVGAALADGQGGRSGRAEAARIAAQSVVAQAFSLHAARLHNRLTRAHTWAVILTGADEAIEASAQGGGFCTLIGLCIGARLVSGASCGDSGVLLVRAGGEAVWLTADQRKNPPVGSGAAHPVAFSSRLFPGDTILVLSDGAFRYVDETAIADVCRAASGQEIVAALRRLQTGQDINRDLPDDFSVIVAQV